MRARPKLLIDTKPLEDERLAKKIFEETDKYSITPTTFKERNFSPDINSELFQDTYEYGKNSVIRFGINIYNESFRKQLMKELIAHNEKLQKTLDEVNEKCSNISGANKYQEFCPKYIELAVHENFAIQNVLSHMKEKDQKVALVDIFPRESSNKNKIVVGGINTNKLDFHTVLLYKTATNQILVIDPNNPMFSSHLSKYGDGSVIQTLCTTDQKYKIYSRPEKSETGFGQGKFRDCIDLAVKLAFLLNQDQTLYSTIDDIMASNAVKLITNNSLIDGMEFNHQNLVRIKQSSNIEKIIQCNERMKQINEKIIQENLEFEIQRKALEDTHYLALNNIMQEKDTLMGQLQTEYTPDYN